MDRAVLVFLLVVLVCVVTDVAVRHLGAPAEIVNGVRLFAVAVVLVVAAVLLFRYLPAV